MTQTQWLYKYVFKGIGWVFLLTMLTILYVAATGCNRTTSRAEDLRQKEATRRILGAQFGDADEQIRKYTKSTTQFKKKRKVEVQ